MYEETNGNGRKIVRLYRQWYPCRCIPNHRLFTSSYERLCEVGSFRINSHCGRDRSPRRFAVEEAIEETIYCNSRISTRTIALDIDAQKSSVWRVLHYQYLHLYHFQQVHTVFYEMISKEWILYVGFCNALSHSWISRFIPCSLMETCFSRSSNKRSRKSFLGP